MARKFTRANLKDRMVVELANGTKYMVIGDYLVNNYNMMIYIPQYDDNLYNQQDLSDYRAIDKVYAPCEYLDIEHYPTKLIWSRQSDDELKTIKVKQSRINEKMMEYYKSKGYDLKIIPDSKEV